MYVPQAYQPAALAAMTRVFQRNAERDARQGRHVDCVSLEDEVDRWVLADGRKLGMAASAHLGGGEDQVKFSRRAVERTATLPIGIFGPLGDHDDPITQAVWISAILQFGGPKSSPDPGWAGAQLVRQ